MIKTGSLRSARERARLTQQAAADLLGYTLSGYSKIERGKRKMTAEFIRRAAEAFGCDPADIIREVIADEEEAAGGLPPIDPETLASFVAEAKDRLASLPLSEARNLVLALISAARKP